MSTTRGRLVPVLLAATVLVGGANLAAYAANGRPLLLGQTNTETRTATVHNTGNGPALSLRSEAGAPSLAVSSTKKVGRLNADRVDGLNASDLQTVARRYAVPTGGPHTFAEVVFPGLPAGRYLASYTIITTSASTAPQCYFRESAPPATAQGLTWGVDAGSFNANNATTLLDTRGGPATLYCAGAEFSFYSAAGDADSNVVFTSVDRSSDATSTPAPRPAHRERGGATGRR